MSLGNYQSKADRHTCGRGDAGLNDNNAAGATIRAAGDGLKHERQVYGSRLELHFGSTRPRRVSRATPPLQSFAGGDFSEAAIQSARFNFSAWPALVQRVLSLAALK
jgi:hypothetical protein